MQTICVVGEWRETQFIDWGDNDLRIEKNK